MKYQCAYVDTTWNKSSGWMQTYFKCEKYQFPAKSRQMENLCIKLYFLHILSICLVQYLKLLTVKAIQNRFANIFLSLIFTEILIFFLWNETSYIKNYKKLSIMFHFPQNRPFPLSLQTYHFRILSDKFKLKQSLAENYIRKTFLCNLFHFLLLFIIMDDNCNTLKLFENEVIHRYMYIYTVLCRKSQVCIHSLADLNKGHCVEFTFLKSKLG